MPYTDTTYTGAEAKAKAREGGFCAPDMAQKADDVEKLELICSSFDDAGADWSEWRAYDVAGRLIDTRRMGGY